MFLTLEAINIMVWESNDMMLKLGAISLAYHNVFQQNLDVRLLQECARIITIAQYSTKSCACDRAYERHMIKLFHIKHITDIDPVFHLT